MGPIVKFSNEFNIVRLTGKFVKLCAASAALVVIAAAFLLFGSAVGVLRLALVLVLLYGGLTLAGSVVERVWAATLRFAKRRQVKYPRAAACMSVAAFLFVIALVFTAAFETPAGRAASAIIAGGFLFVGSCLVVGRWLAAGWDMVSALREKNSC